MDDIRELRLEDERAFLARMTESGGWKLFVKHWLPMCEASAAQLRAPDNPNRDWTAGLVAGYEKLLRYPDARIKEITRELTKRPLEAK